MKKIYFTVTNDLVYDQRMQRICTSLAKAGYRVTLVGRKRPSSPPLAPASYQQKRLRCLFQKGKGFYAEYNIRLFFYLLFRKMDALCAIDLDTILPCLYISRIKNIPRIYDAHELFTGLKEVATRPSVLKAWTRIERKTVPLFKYGYTVSESIADEFHKRYGVKYATIRNLPVLQEWEEQVERGDHLLYLGAINEARAFEFFIPALQWVDRQLVVCGDGNFMPKLKALIREYKQEEKIELKGMLPPLALGTQCRRARIGIAFAENTGLNQFLALPNKFFDYIHGGLPQIAMNYPEYRKINAQFEVAILVDDLIPEKMAAIINNLLEDTVLYRRLAENCRRARLELNWQQEEKKLIAFYQSVFNN